MELIRKPKSNHATGIHRIASRFGFVLLALVFLFSCSRATPDISVVDGEATLKRLTMHSSGPLALHGFWDFVPDGAVSSTAYHDARTVSVPGTWPEDLFSKQKDSVHRKGLYQLKLHLNSLDPFALRFTEVMTESCIYLDGKKIQCQGRTGETREQTVPNTTPFTVVLIPERLDPVLHIQVSNFHHRKGGIFGSVMVGTPAQIQTLDRNRMSRYLLVAGGLLLTALYFAVVGLFEGRAGTNLSLALFCFIALVRIMTAGEKPVASFFPGLPYAIYLRLQYITYFLSIAAALHYLYTMFPADAHRAMVRLVYAIALLFSGFAVVSSTTLLSYSLDYYAVVFFGVTFYCTYVISRASYYRRTGSYFIFLGMMALFVAVVVDFLRVYEVALIEYLVGDAILVLILCQAVATSLQNRNVHVKMGQLQTEKDLADAAARNNREFLSRMSHELRTPLHSIVHIGHLLKDEKDPTRTADYVETLQSASDHLLTLVNDVLDFNRMVQGKLRYQEGSFSLGLLLNRVVVIHRERAAGKGLDLKLEIDRSLPDRYLGDSHRIAQVMHNLIGNAIKFTYKGEIRVTVKPEVPDSPEKGILISVSDTGIGMSPDQIPQIFESYFQGGFQTDRKHEGTGLGLAISRELVRLMGGELRVQSEPNRGSTFSFNLPVIPDPDRYRTPEVEEISEAFAAATRDPGSSRAFRQELVLIVDDNPDNRKLTGRFLEKWNLRYLEASSGTESLRILEGYYPHLILLDLHMPEMDGFATLSALRDKGYTGPIIAATADVSNETRLRLEAAGFDGFIGKPFSPAKFHQVLSGYLNSGNLRNQSPANEPYE